MSKYRCVFVVIGYWCILHKGTISSLYDLLEYNINPFFSECEAGGQAFITTLLFVFSSRKYTLSHHLLTQHRKASRSPHSQVELATSSNTFPSPLTVIQSHCSAEWTLLNATGSSSSMTCVSTTSWRP